MLQLGQTIGKGYVCSCGGGARSARACRYCGAVALLAAAPVPSALVALLPWEPSSCAQDSMRYCS